MKTSDLRPAGNPTAEPGSHNPPTAEPQRRGCVSGLPGFISAVGSGWCFSRLARSDPGATWIQVIGFDPELLEE